MGIARCGALILTVVLAFTGRVSAQPAGGAPLFDYRDVTLDNGLRVITLEDFSCPVVAVHLWYHVGSKDENPERQGFAHMFEHMMFQGTDRLGPTGHFDYIHRVGGDCNAYTAFDQTVYVQMLPAHQLPLALHLEAERMSFLRIDQKSFDTERKVVEEERRLGLNQPYGTALEQLLDKIFTVHPYRWSPIGKIPHLRAAAVQELRDFWSTYYVPNNATLIVVGAVKHADVQKLATSSFGWIPRGADPARVTVREPMPTKARAITIKEKNAPTPITGYLFFGPDVSSKDTTPVQMLTTILGGGESSRLYRSLVADQQLAAMAAAGAMSLEQQGMIAAGGVLLPFGGSVKKVQKAIEVELEKIRTEAVTPAELDKARNQMLSGVVGQRLTAVSKASVLGEAAVLQGDISRVNRQIDEIRAVTADDIKRVAAEYLAPERRVRITVDRNLMGGVFGGKNPEEDAPITAVAETETPPPGRAGAKRPAAYASEPPVAAPEPFKASPDFEQATLDNGLAVVVVANHEVPYVTVQLALDAGTWSEPAPGSAQMAATLLTKGTATRSEKQLAEELDGAAISLGGSASADGSSVAASCVSDQIEKAMALLADVTLNPTFPAKEFEKARKQARTGLTIQAQQPEYQADREMRRRLYGAHPYSRSVQGELADLDALNAEQVAAWWKRAARPDGSTLIFAGDITLDRALKLARASFGAWKGEGEAMRPTFADPPSASATKIVLVDRPGSVQSQIRAGHLSIMRRDPRFATAEVVGSYFGGAFGSRLNEEIRVKRGLTYGASGGFGAARFAGSFRVSTFSKTPSTAPAVQAVIDEIKRVRVEGPTPKEFGDARTHFLGSFAIARETPQAVAGDVMMLRRLGLPADYYDVFVRRVTETTPEQCLALAKDVVDPDRLVIVVVGDARAIKADLEKIAPVEVVAAEVTPEPADATPEPAEEDAPADAQPAGSGR